MTVGLWDLRVMLAPLDRSDLRVIRANKAPKVQLAPKDLKVMMDPRAPKVQKDQQAQTDQQDQRE